MTINYKKVVTCLLAKNVLKRQLKLQHSVSFLTFPFLLTQAETRLLAAVYKFIYCAFFALHTVLYCS